MAAEIEFEFDRIRAIELWGFLEFLQLEAGARAWRLLTRAGRREEACILGELSRDLAGEHGEAGDNECGG